MTWSELDEAIAANRPADALRIALDLWRATRATELADLVEALAPFVEEDAARLGVLLANLEDAVIATFQGDWFARDWGTELGRSVERLAAIEDPRVATVLVELLFHPHVGGGLNGSQPIADVLLHLRDARAWPRLREPRRTLLGIPFRRATADALESLAPPSPLAPSELAVVARGLARYRDAPATQIAAILDPERRRDDGTEEVAADALTEMGHPFGEAIALEYDEATGTISAEGRQRLRAVLAMHERQWIGRPLAYATTERRYRGGLIDELTLHSWVEPGVLESPWLGRLRVLRANVVYWDERQADRLREAKLARSLEWLDVPSFEFLCAVVNDTYPHLRGIRLDRLRQTRENEIWPSWSAALSDWLPRLPSLREVVFRTIPERGLEQLIEGIVQEKLHEKIATLSLDATRWSYVQMGERDPRKWFQRIDAHPPRRAALYYTDAALIVEWSPDGLVVILETSEGGPALDLLRHLPRGKAIARLVFRDFPGRRPRRLAKIGRLRRILDDLAPRDVEMPIRWKNRLAGLSGG